MTSDSDSSTVRLEVPARPDYLVLARLALSAVCRLTPLPAEDVADLKLAISEAASAFFVGAEDGAELEPGAPVPAAGGGRLSFAFELDDDRLALEIGGPDHAEMDDGDHELGRAIIAATVDECDYGHRRMRLVKYLPEPRG